MKIRRTKPTMKQQLFLFFMLAAVLVCLIFSAYYFVSEQRVLRNNLERENTKNLQYAIEKIEENAMRVEEFANQICQNGQIRALMLADDPFAPTETMAVASMLDEQFQFVTVTEDILSLYLIGENGLDIRRGKEAALVDRDAVYRAFCSDAFFADGGIACWGSGADNPCRFSQYETVLPYSRRIIDETTGRTAGYLVILLREAVLTNIGDALLGQKNTAFCLVDTTDSYVVRSDGWKRLSAHTEQDLRRMAMNEEHRLRDAPYQFFKRSSSVYDWCIVEAVSTYEFAQQRSILLQAFVVVGALALLYIVQEHFERNELPIRTVLTNSCRSYEELLHMETLGEVIAWLDALRQDLSDFLLRESEKGGAKIVGMAQDWIAAHYREAASLQEAARAVSLNPSYFSTLLKKFTGKSYTELLMEYRIERAKELLLLTDAKVYRVGQMVGYEDKFYFSRIFKRVTGMTPVEFKNQRREG